MTIAFVRKSRDEMIQYERDNVSSYRTSDGIVVESQPNEKRINYDEHGSLMGMKFGDGDTAKIPVQPNPNWNSNEAAGGTLVAIGQAPQGVTWLKCGMTSIVGIDAHKLHIIELTPAQVATLDERITAFPNSDDVSGDCHLLMVKYYQQRNINFGIEQTAMTELNTFLHGAWK